MQADSTFAYVRLPSTFAAMDLPEITIQQNAFANVCTTFIIPRVLTLPASGFPIEHTPTRPDFGQQKRCRCYNN